MKLVFCTRCSDIFKLEMAERRCICGASAGSYEPDGWHAWYSGRSAVPLGIINGSLRKAVISQKMPSSLPQEDNRFEAFVFPEGHERFERRDETDA